MDILSDKTVKTRKDHICDACFGKIPKGSNAHVQVNVVDEIQTWRTCATCTELTTKHRGFFEDTDGVCYSGCVRDQLRKGSTPEMLLEVLNATEDVL